MQVKFSCVPGDRHMGSPTSAFFGIGDSDYVVPIRDLFHFEKVANRGRTSLDTNEHEARPVPFSQAAIEPLIALRRQLVVPFSVLRVGLQTNSYH